MQVRIDRIPKLSGTNMSTYCVVDVELDRSLLEVFFDKYGVTHKGEISNIVERIHSMAHEFGARPQFFKQYEGKPGDGVCALFDDEEHKLRLYCIRFGYDIIIVGGGGQKDVKAWQHSTELSRAAEQMIKLSREIMIRLKNKDIVYSKDGLTFEGDLDDFEI